MRSSSLVASALLVSVLAAPGLASAKGCLKGAAVGGVGAHVAGHHGLIGAAAGCAVGHHRATKKANAEKANADQNAAAKADAQASAKQRSAAPAQPAPAKP